MRQPDPSGPALAIERLSKSYGPHPVLTEVTFLLDPGTIAVLSGANGTGKSTLLRCLAGLTPFGGTAAVAGLPVDGKRDVRRLIGYLPQNVSLPDAVTVGEVIAFFAKLRGVEQDDSGLPEGFLPAAERPIGILSGGQRQRVALSVALLGRPSLLLLDEPVANLDELGREGFWATLRDLRERGVSALVASPLPGDLAGVAGRAIVLDDGKIVFDGPMDGPHPVPSIGRGPGPERAPGHELEAEA